MSSIKRAEVGPLVARWPGDLRLLLLAGPDESGVRVLAADALRALADPADPLSVVELSPDRLKQDPALLADEAAATSMFGSRRVIRVDGAADAAAEAVALLLAAPAAGNPVIMTAGDLKKTSALWKLADGAGTARVALCYALEARDLQRWIDTEARGLGLSLAPGVAARLAASADQDLGVLAQELEKFALYLDAAPDRPQRLEDAHLLALGVDALDDDMAALIGALISGNGRAFDAQLALLPPGNAIGLLRQLARRLMQLHDLRAAVDAGKSPAEAVAGARPPIFWKERDQTVAALGRWTAPRILRAIASVLEAEAAIKSPGSAGDVLGTQAVAMIAAASSAAGVGVSGRRP